MPEQEQTNRPHSYEGQNVEYDSLRIRKARGFRGITKPVTVRIAGADAQTAAQYTTPFFIADRPYEIVEVKERHETAGSDAGSVTVMLKKVPSGTAPGSGTDTLASGISLKATANTNQSGTLHATLSNRRLDAGDALALVSTGTLTAVVGVTVAVTLKAI